MAGRPSSLITHSAFRPRSDPPPSAGTPILRKSFMASRIPRLTEEVPGSTLRRRELPPGSVAYGQRLKVNRAGCMPAWGRSRGGGRREHACRRLLGLIACLVWCTGVERWLRVIFDDQLNRFSRYGPVDPPGQRQGHVDTGRDTRAADERFIKDDTAGADGDAHRGQDVPERPVRGGSSAGEDPGGGVDAGAGADRGHPRRVL